MDRNKFKSKKRKLKVVFRQRKRTGQARNKELGMLWSVMPKRLRKNRPVKMIPILRRQVPIIRSRTRKNVRRNGGKLETR